MSNKFIPTVEEIPVMLLKDGNVITNHGKSFKTVTDLVIHNDLTSITVKFQGGSFTYENAFFETVIILKK